MSCQSSGAKSLLKCHFVGLHVQGRQPCQSPGSHDAWLVLVEEFEGLPVMATSHLTPNLGVADQFRIEDSKVVEHWGVLDSGALIQQLTGGAPNPRKDFELGGGI